MRSRGGADPGRRSARGARHLAACGCDRRGREWRGDISRAARGTRRPRGRGARARVARRPRPARERARGRRAALYDCEGEAAPRPRARARVCRAAAPLRRCDRGRPGRSQARLGGPLAARAAVQHGADHPAHRRGAHPCRGGATRGCRTAAVCGIVGYTGARPAAPLLLEGLKRLEYRGYESAGVALVEDGRTEVRKAAGRIAALERELGPNLPPGHTGIAHTRWATPGAPSTANTHPHTDCGGTLALIHNGIIENAGLLRTALVRRGHVFRSETDTEVLAHLIEEAHAKGGALVGAVAGALQPVEGTYGIAVVSTREPDTIVAARRGSPLLVAIGSGENFIASDASAVLAHTRSVVYLDDGEIAVVRPGDYRILDLDSVEKEKAVTRVDWDLGTVERGGYAHFMLKEILEQPESVRNTLRGRLLEEDGTAKLGGLNIEDRKSVV